MMLRMVLLGSLAVASALAAEDVGKVGAGGYLLQRPKPCKPLPETLYKTANVTGPMVTNQWWSSLVFTKYSQPLFAHPLMVRCSETGLIINYPGAAIKGAAAGIFGVGGNDGDFKIAHSTSATFPSADCDGYSDWFVSAAFASGPATLRASFGHGSPFVYCLFGGGDAVVNFKKAPVVWAGDENEAVLGVTVNGNHYGLFGATGSTWSGLSGASFLNAAKGKNYFSVALLPDNKPETLALFTKYAYSHVQETRVDFAVEKGVLKSTYRFVSKPYEGSETKTLFALYPHQWKYTKTQLTVMTYGTVRGTMKLAEGSEFVTDVPVQGLLPMFPGESIADKQRMIGYLKEEAEKKIPGFADTYWEGKYLGRLATLSGIAEVCGEISLQKQFVDEIKRRLENWFSATPGKEKPVFYYNKTWGTLIGSPPSYGSDTLLNDHHFHYGYFVRAAAEVARLDAAWAKEWGPMVEMVMREIASTDRQDKLFPHLRCFDAYAGHSWASGNADFADGNNQESSSESLNAWYGMILWGQATRQSAIRDAGLFLFNTERTAVEEYWFDVSGTNYPKDFPNVALGMVWGGKGAFGTWFSADIDCIHGINWLPFTPASIYMGRHPDYVKKNHDRIVAKRKTGSDYNSGWGDLLVMFNSLQDPAAGAKYFDANPKCKLEGGNSHAFMYHWIQTLDRLGINDASITADYPIVNVFKKGEARTYVAYNYEAQPLTVTFSDGVKLVAKPKGLSSVTK